jgi:hypothetical protein
LISARQRSPSFCTLVTLPLIRTSRHSCATVGIVCRTIGDGTAALPATSSRSARRRGAPYATPTRPTTRARVPTGGAFVPVGSSTSMAAEPSWTTIRRPVESSSVAGAVTMPAIATSRSSILRARAIVSVAELDVVLPPVGDGLADTAGPATTVMSAASRTQIR